MARKRYWMVSRMSLYLALVNTRGWWYSPSGGMSLCVGLTLLCNAADGRADRHHLGQATAAVAFAVIEFSHLGR